MSLNKELKEFAKLVKLMREKQKAYFRGRSAADLSQAKHFEHLVDKQIAHLNPTEPNTQKTLL